MRSMVNIGIFIIIAIFVIIIIFVITTIIIIAVSYPTIDRTSLTAEQDLIIILVVIFDLRRNSHHQLCYPQRYKYAGIKR